MSDVTEACGTCVGCGTGYPEHCSVVELMRQIEELKVEEAKAQAGYTLALEAFRKARREYDAMWEAKYAEWEATRERSTCTYQRECPCGPRESCESCWYDNGGCSGCWGCLIGDEEVF
jgi:hypothetical protein